MGEVNKGVSLDNNIDNDSQGDVSHMQKYESESEVSIEEKCSDGKQKEIKLKWYFRQDLWVWFWGMVFCAGLVIAIELVGNMRGWDAESGYTHNQSETSQDRFLPEPYIPEEGVRGRYGPEATARWYYWQIKPEMRTFWTHFFPWIAYICHQVLIWATIYFAQMKKAEEPLGKGRYSSKLNSFNWIAFGLNIFFHIIHFINTHVTYDATAPDVSISTSQGSVIMLLVFVMLLEYKERGLFFGWPVPSNKDKVSKKLLLDFSPINIVRKYHGYAFAWAAIYTFWYHPMENTLGHIVGFIYTWIIMLQGTLMFTDFHLNKYWRMTQEIFVIVHGGVVAAQTGGDSLKGTSMWPMFVFGFALCFVLTQIFSLPFWPLVPTWCRFIPLVTYTAIVVWAYSWIPDKNGNAWVRMPEIFRIPATYYLFFFMGWGLLFAFLKIDKKCFKTTSPTIIKKDSEKSLVNQVLLLSAAMFIYGVHIGLAICAQLLDWQMGLIVLMIIFVAIFTLGCSISFMFLRHAIPSKIIVTKEVQDDEKKSGFHEQIEHIEKCDQNRQNTYTTF